MKKLWISVTLVILLTSQAGNLLSNYQPAAAVQQTVRQQRELQQQRLEERREAFTQGREVLKKANVPFEPDELLGRSWRKRLAPRLWQMPQMAEVREAGNKIKGAQLADVLYLPDKVELEGDTVILVRKLIFLGRNAVIKGNYSLHIFPVEMTGMIDAVAEAKPSRGGQLKKVNFNTYRSKLASLPVIRDGLVTINLHGRGRKEWLEEQQKAKKDNGLRANHASAVPQQNVGTPGQTGNQGGGGSTGSTGAGGSGGNNGNNGTCGANVHGAAGGNGTPGGAGGTGGNGTSGGGGTNGSPFSISIPSGDHTSYNISTYGGDGGQGGSGGSGGLGGSGANGGRGGDGASCACNLGGSGNGGQGGNGGAAGNGGQGGNGGTGARVEMAPT